MLSHLLPRLQSQTVVAELGTYELVELEDWKFPDKMSTGIVKVSPSANHISLRREEFEREIMSIGGESCDFCC